MVKTHDISIDVNQGVRIKTAARLFRTQEKKSWLSIPKKEREDERVENPEIPPTIYKEHGSLVLVSSTLLSTQTQTHRHTHAAKCLKAEQGARPDYSRWVLGFLRLGSKMRGEADCLSTVYSLHCLCTYSITENIHSLTLSVYSTNIILVFSYFRKT